MKGPEYIEKYKKITTITDGFFFMFELIFIAGIYVSYKVYENIELTKIWLWAAIVCTIIFIIVNVILCALKDKELKKYANCGISTDGTGKIFYIETKESTNEHNDN